MQCEFQVLRILETPVFPPPSRLCFHHHVEQLIFICLLSNLGAVTIPSSLVPAVHTIEETQQVIVEEGRMDEGREGGGREGRGHYLLIMSL